MMRKRERGKQREVREQGREREEKRKRKGWRGEAGRKNDMKLKEASSKRLTDPSCCL